MGDLTISLEDGFDNDHVIVAVDEIVVLDEERISTRFQISLAREFTVPAPADPCRVRVRIPERRLDSTLEVDAGRTPTILVSIHDGRLQMRATDLPRHA